MRNEPGEAEALDAATIAATVMVVGAGVFSFIMNIFMQAGLQKLISALRNLQVIVHIMLMETFCVIHAKVFSTRLLEIVNFEFYDPGELYVKYLPIEESDPLSLNFEEAGY